MACLAFGTYFHGFSFGGLGPFLSWLGFLFCSLTVWFAGFFGGFAFLHESLQFIV